MSTSEPPQEPSLAEQVALLREQLSQAQKLTALGELVSTTTHEFNNVLTTIINYAKMGMRHRDQPTRDKVFEKIMAAGLAPRGSPTAFWALPATALPARADRPGQADRRLAAAVGARDVEIPRSSSTSRFQAVPPAMVNSNQIQQVLINLLVNARQAMPGGGHILMRLSSRRRATAMVDLIVRDTGVGIPADKLPRIFNRFYTTKSGPDASGKGGTGLGLSFCRDVIEAHHGRLRVESTLGKGTAFTLKLPAAQQPDPSTLPLTTHEPNPRRVIPRDGEAVARSANIEPVGKSRGAGDSPILLRGLRKIGTVPDELARSELGGRRDQLRHDWLRHRDLFWHDHRNRDRRTAAPQAPLNSAQDHLFDRHVASLRYPTQRRLEPAHRIRHALQRVVVAQRRRVGQADRAGLRPRHVFQLFVHLHFDTETGRIGHHAHDRLAARRLQRRLQALVERRRVVIPRFENRRAAAWIGVEPALGQKVADQSHALFFFDLESSCPRR